jgi:tRNA nucleotidyltransferase/poly(A) polymerase
MKVYEVGGCVRDSLLNIKSNDIDYVIEASSYSEMKTYVEKNSKIIFLEKPQFGTIRYMSLDGTPEDISLCVKSRSIDKSSFEIGNIIEDLKNRDFTINSIARLKNTQELLDPNNGINDLSNKLIKCVSDPKTVFDNDPARIIRAIRFKIQFGFELDSDIKSFLYETKNFASLLTINRERLRQELDKCLKVSSKQTIIELNQLGSEFLDIIFDKHKLCLNLR